MSNAWNRKPVKDTKALQMYRDVEFGTAPTENNIKDAVTEEFLIDNWLGDFSNFTLRIRPIGEDRRPTNGKVPLNIKFATEYTLQVSTFLNSDRKSIARIYDEYGAGPFIIYYNLDAETDDTATQKTSFIARASLDDGSIASGDGFYNQPLTFNFDSAPIPFILSDS